MCSFALCMIEPKRIFEWTQTPNAEEFETVALAVFRHQAEHCAVYARYLQVLGRRALEIRRLKEVPFLPIELFKTQRIVSDIYMDLAQARTMVFTSSGTTGMQQSRHEVLDLSWYEESFRRGFQYFYGEEKDWAVLALLPSYQEREGSSLIYMVDDLIAHSTQPESGYFLYDHQQLYETLLTLKARRTKTLLLGVSYALLDFAEKFQISGFPELVVMETGGMKGRRKEMVREELHELLQSAFGVPNIHSEYGMTELLSQAYSHGGGHFECPPWMKIFVRDTNDPFSYLPEGRSGGINVVDLANYHSCSFIATQDLGRIRTEAGATKFEVLGRFDHSDIRGCNLLVL